MCFTFCVVFVVMMTAFMNQLLKTHCLRMIAFSMSSESENYFLFVCCNTIFYAHTYCIVNTQMSWYVDYSEYYYFCIDLMIKICVNYWTTSWKQSLETWTDLIYHQPTFYLPKSLITAVLLHTQEQRYVAISPYVLNESDDNLQFALYLSWITNVDPH